MLIQTTVPKQAFGNNDVKISKICLGGGSFIGIDSQVLLDEALKHGLDCWEIVSFTGKVYGEYFQKHPGIREEFKYSPLFQAVTQNKEVPGSACVYRCSLDRTHRTFFHKVRVTIGLWLDKKLLCSYSPLCRKNLMLMMMDS